MGFEVKAIDCPTCGHRLSMAEIDSAKGLAVCSACHGVMSIQSKDRSLAAQQAEERVRPLAARPNGVTVEDTGSMLTISMQWYTPAVYFLVAFCVFWDSVVVAFLFGGAFFFLGSGGHWNAFALPFFLIPLIHVVVGLGLTYFTVCCFLNRTVIQVDSFQMSVRFGPLPWPGSVTYEAASIAQVFCKASVNTDSDGVRTTRYGLYCLTRENKAIPLLSHCPDSDHALFFEQEIERFLKIQDRPVPGDWV